MNIKKIVAFSLIGGTIMLGNIAYGEDMKDLSGHWAKDRVETLVSEGIVSGYPDGTFRPDAAITRGEVSKLLSEYIGDRKTSDTGFKDIEGIWSTDYIKHLAFKKVVSGYPDGTFRPENNITRAEFVTMTYNYLSETGENLDSPLKEKFIDVNNHWAKKNISGIEYAGYISGYPDRTFRPDAAITRAEASSIIADMYENRVPKIKTPWSENHESNMDVLIEDLGFESDKSGNWNRVKSLQNPVGVYRDNPELYEVSIVISNWETDDVKGSEKIPHIFDELLKFYFEDEAEYAYSYMDNTEVTDFETSDRFVRMQDRDEKLYIYIGYKGLKKFDKWW